MDDPYLTLGVPVDSDRRSIRSAYLAKARRHHPDHGGDVAGMARLNEAYEVLGDPQARARFDAHPERRHARRRAAEPWTGTAGAPPGRPSGSILEFGVFAGWSLGEVARRDPGYLRWLAEHTDGRPFVAEIEDILGPQLRPAPTTQSRARPR
jgi:curved DNA-binding protein CbpA